MPSIATSQQVRPAIQVRGGRLRVPFFTGARWSDGSRKIAVRKPQQRNWCGISVWVVQYAGFAALVDPEVVNGTTVFNIAYSIN